jgi:GNAT superfamily N-acetyltransferase
MNEPNELNEADRLSFVTATAADLKALVAIRVEAMRESLELIGRFDPERARERFSRGFVPECTQFVLVNGTRAGFVVVKPQDGELLLDHLYLKPSFQGQGLGTEILAKIFARADVTGAPIRLGALRQSASNRFYLRHGFTKVTEGEWDIYYVRWPRLS